MTNSILGYLFFLQNGIFFGFKKPLSFFGFEDIESISYTSVLQRTFNLNIAYKPSASAEVQEIEFAMLDQADFPGIDTYIKRHQLQDASMAEARRAQKLKANKSANAVNGDAADTEEPSELEKAQQQIEEEEDEEDEMEEDYDPGEDGDSDDSGSSSDGEEYDDSYPKSNGRDLVKEELGSEAEEVESEEGEDEDEEEEEQGDEEQEEEVVDEHAPDPEDEDQLWDFWSHKIHVSHLWAKACSCSLMLWMCFPDILMDGRAGLYLLHTYLWKSRNDLRTADRVDFGSTRRSILI